LYAGSKSPSRKYFISMPTPVRTVTVRSDAKKVRLFTLDRERDLEETDSYEGPDVTVTLKENTVVYLEFEC